MNLKEHSARNLAPSRREFLATLGSGILCAATPAWAKPQSANDVAYDNDFWNKPRSLWLFRKDTRETLKATYYQNGQLQGDDYWKICALMRDIRQNEMFPMNVPLFDVLRGIQGFYEQYGWNYPIVINSGFRTEKTNNSLLKEGAAKNSMHLVGKAADISFPGVPVRDIGRLGMYFSQGGVGFYESRGFTHLDTGALRQWRG